MPSLAALSRELSSQVGRIERRFPKLASARATLVSEPEQPEANEVVGRLRCFVAKDWSSGAPLLTRASGPWLRWAARREVMPHARAEDLLAVVDSGLRTPCQEAMFIGGAAKIMIHELRLRPVEGDGKPLWFVERR